MYGSRQEYQAHVNAVCQRCGLTRFWHSIWSPPEKRAAIAAAGCDVKSFQEGPIE
jgi:hypothetical protein